MNPARSRWERSMGTSFSLRLALLVAAQLVTALVYAQTSATLQGRVIVPALFNVPTRAQRSSARTVLTVHWSAEDFPGTPPVDEAIDRDCF
jgi:hypothetical protein